MLNSTHYLVRHTVTDKTWQNIRSISTHKSPLSSQDFEPRRTTLQGTHRPEAATKCTNPLDAKGVCVRNPGFRTVVCACDLKQPPRAQTH